MRQNPALYGVTAEEATEDPVRRLDSFIRPPLPLLDSTLNNGIILPLDS